MQELDKHLLPHRQRWTQNSIAKLVQADRRTVKIYAERISILVPDYLDECPRNPDKTVAASFPLTDYQAWVVCQVIALGRLIRSEVNGLAVHKIVKKTIVKRRDLLSKASWEACENSRVAS